MWATAACALHDIQQLEPKVLPNGIKKKSLTINEDPLAYLGILVDCLQEWDRYSVSRESAIGTKSPLQGTDVRLGSKRGKIQVNFGSKEATKKVKGNLSNALIGWDRYVEVVES